MALATRCPHCSTTFRVANDQLKLHAGLVRCGKCQQTFNGVENLIPLDAHGRALSQSLPGPIPGEATPPPHQAQPPETAAHDSATTDSLTAVYYPSASPIEVTEHKAVPDETTTTIANEPIAKPVAPSAIVESKVLRPSEPTAAAPVIQHLSTIKRPEVWRHTPASSQPASSTPATPVKSAAITSTAAAKEANGKTARPLARPIDSARLGNVWASQATSTPQKNELLTKIEPTLDHPKEANLRASDLEFDLSMPTRQFIDPALADEWFKLEQASFQHEAATNDNNEQPVVDAAPEKPTPASAVAPETRLEPYWERTAQPESAESISEQPDDSPEPQSTLSPEAAGDQLPAAVTAAEIVATVVKEIKQADTETASNTESVETMLTTEENQPQQERVPADQANQVDEALLAKTVLMSELESADSEAVSTPLSNALSSGAATTAGTDSPAPEAMSENAEAESQPASEEAEEPGFVLAAERARRWSRITTVLMSLALLLLLPLFAAQLAYTGRNYLVQWYPPSKPYLVQACQYLQCQLKLPAQIDYVNIDSHELQAQIPEKNIYSLNLLVQNQSPFAQAWPHVELILHDKREKAVLRKVFTPADYLSPQEMQRINELGLSAKGEYTIKLYFEQSNTKAAGYHVSVFYP